MTHDSPIHDVSDTAFWVAYYRAKETERADAIFKDPFAKSLVGNRGREIAEAMPEIGRYTEWSVVSRTVIIDRFIPDAVRNGVDAVINLGTGLDARPYRMNLPESLVWVEADYPGIIRHKNGLLAHERPRCRLSRHEVDLAVATERKRFLSSAAPEAKKVLILTEGVIPYLTPEQVSELAADLKSQPRFAYWITEYFNRRVYGVLKKSVRTKAMKNAPFQFYPDDWFGFFKATGWIEEETRYTGEVAVEFNRKPPMPRFAELLFPWFPKKVKEQAGRMTGYTLLKKAAIAD